VALPLSGSGVIGGVSGMGRIFRYYKAERGLEVLNDLETWTSIPTELNDPFEVLPNIDPTQFTKRRLEAILRQDFYIERAYRREGRQLGFGSKKRYKHWYRKDVARRAAEALPKIPKNVEALRGNFPLKFGSYWRLLCTSLVYDSVLMWSHYAAKHTGLVLAFDTAEKPFSEIPKECWLTVKYSDQKPDYVYALKDREFSKKMFAVAGIKAKNWSYEQEIRIVLADISLRKGRFLLLTPKSIAAVFCGYRISEEHKAAVQVALKHPEVEHVELWQGALDKSEYALQFMRGSA
jgi:hypothetical protein